MFEVNINLRQNIPIKQSVNLNQKDSNLIKTMFYPYVYKLTHKSTGYFNARLLTANLTTKSLFNTSITQAEFINEVEVNHET